MIVGYALQLSFLCPFYVGFSLWMMGHVLSYEFNHQVFLEGEQSVMVAMITGWMILVQSICC